MVSVCLLWEWRSDSKLSKSSVLVQPTDPSSRTAKPLFLAYPALRFRTRFSSPRVHRPIPEDPSLSVMHFDERPELTMHDNPLKGGVIYQRERGILWRMPTRADNNYPLSIPLRRMTQAELGTFLGKAADLHRIYTDADESRRYSLSLKNPRLKRTNTTSISRATPWQEIASNHFFLAATSIMSPRQLGGTNGETKTAQYSEAYAGF